MKKTVYPLVMAALAAFPVLFSCTEKEQEVSVDNHRFEYRFSLAEDATRALLNDEGVFWEAGDNVGLFTGAAQSLEAEVDAESSPKTIVVQTTDPLAEGTTVYAYYPYVEGNTDVTASKVVFPAEQSGGALSAMPLAGIPTAVHIDSESSTIGVIRFLNLGSIIDFRVYSSTYAGETVESVALQANTGNLAGTATIDLTGVSWNETDKPATIPALTWAEGTGSSTVTLTQSAPVATDKNAAIAGGHLYMVVAPGTYSGTITVTTNAARYTFPFTNKELVLNGLKRFNMNLDNATEREGRFVTYYKATQFDSGYQYMIVSGGMALKNAGNGEIVDAESVTVENDQITREEDPALLWTAADAPELDNYYYGTHTLTSGTEHLWRHSDNGKYTVEGSNASVTKYMIWSYEAEKLWNISVYNGNSSTYYTYYDNGWKSVSSSSAPTVKTNIFTARPPQTLSFRPTTAEYDLYTPGAFVKPTLSGYQTTVTYDSSDKTVATVDADGTVHPLSVGTTTITATAAGTAEYQGATATYELTVINSNLPKYVKAEAIEAGQSYLIVSNGYLLRNESGTATPVAVEVNDGEILFDAASTDLWAATASGTSFNLTNSSQYLRCTTSSSWGSTSVSLSIGTASSTASNNQWTYDATNEYLKVAGSYYLYYSKGNSKWSLSNSQSSTHVAALYKLDDGRLEQKLSFSAEEAEYDLGTSAWTKAVPTLSGAQTTVTYGSSDETVATVDNNGTVTPLKAGTVTITATAAADEQYKKGTASYTLKVVNSSVVAKTYNRVSSVSAGTYLIIGRETASDRVGTYVCKFPPSDDNKCDHEKVSDSSDLTSLTTENDEYGAYEVELIASGSDWLVKVKSSGQYMYFADNKISFTDDASVAAQQITSNGGYPACIKNTNNDQFYHSGSYTCFMYSNGKNANNLRFFKLSE